MVGQNWERTKNVFDPEQRKRKSFTLGNILTEGWGRKISLQMNESNTTDHTQ